MQDRHPLLHSHSQLLVIYCTSVMYMDVTCNISHKHRHVPLRAFLTEILLQLLLALSHPPGNAATIDTWVPVLNFIQ